MRATKLLFVVALLTVAIAAVPSAGALSEAPVVHVLSAGSSAQFLQYEVAAVNDIAPAVPTCTQSGGGVMGASGVTTPSCVIHHWSIKTSDCALCAQLSDNRISGALQPVLQAGNIWIVWVTAGPNLCGAAGQTPCGQTTHIWSDVSVDSTVGVRTFLARAAGGGVGTNLDLNSNVTGTSGVGLKPAQWQSDNATAANLFKYGTFSNGVAVTGTGCTGAASVVNCDDQFLGSDTYTDLAINQNRLTAGLTDIRPEDAKLATKRLMKPLDPTGEFFGLGYGSAGSQLIATTPVISGTGSNAGVTQAQPVAFALPGFTDPFYPSQTVPTTITVLPLGEAPVITLVNRSNTNGLGTLIGTAPNQTYYYSNVYDYAIQNGNPVTKFGKLFEGKDCTGDSATFSSAGYLVQPGPAAAAGQNITINQINDPAADGSLKFIYNQPATATGLAAGDWVTITGSTGGTYDGVYQIFSTQSGGQGPSGTESSFKVVPNPFNTGTINTGETANASYWSASQNFPIHVIIREPLSGTYNTFEFNQVRIFGGQDGSNDLLGYDGGAISPSAKSQEANFSDAAGTLPITMTQGNPAGATVPTEISLNPCWGPPNDGSTNGDRSRSIGNGEETNGAGSLNYPSTSAVTNGVLHTQDAIGYGFFSFANVASMAVAGAPNGPIGYVTIDNVDPVFDSYAGVAGYDPGQPSGNVSGALPGTLPICNVNGTAPACNGTTFWNATTKSFPHLRDGTYRSWSLLRALCDTANVHCLKATDPYGMEGLMAKTQDEVHGGTSVPDFVAFSDDGSFGPAGGTGDAVYYRSHFVPGDDYGFGIAFGASSTPSNVVESGGDVGGCITPLPTSDLTGQIGSTSGVAPYNDLTGEPLLGCQQ